MNKSTNELRNVLLKAEMKRIGERLMKKELCDIYGFNYNYYMNCISDRNAPSMNMVEKLTEYLATPTTEVYERVFAKRKREQEEDYHDKIEFKEEDVNILLAQLSEEGIFKEPRM